MRSLKRKQRNDVRFRLAYVGVLCVTLCVITVCTLRATLYVHGVLFCVYYVVG